MTDAAKATPRPWQLSDTQERFIAGPNGSPIAFAVLCRKPDDTKLPGESWLNMMQRTAPERAAINAEKKANAALIVQAVNSHDALVAAVNEILPMCGDVSGDEETQWTRAVLKLRAALAKARGQ